MPTLGNLLVLSVGLCFGVGFLLFPNPLHSITYRTIVDSTAITVVAPHWDIE